MHLTSEESNIKASLIFFTPRNDEKAKVYFYYTVSDKKEFFFFDDLNEYLIYFFEYSKFCHLGNF